MVVVGFRAAWLSESFRQGFAGGGAVYYVAFCSIVVTCAFLLGTMSQNSDGDIIPGVLHSLIAGVTAFVTLRVLILRNKT